MGTMIIMTIGWEYYVEVTRRPRGKDNNHDHHLDYDHHDQSTPLHHDDKIIMTTRWEY